MAGNSNQQTIPDPVDNLPDPSDSKPMPTLDGYSSPASSNQIALQRAIDALTGLNSPVAAASELTHDSFPSKISNRINLPEVRNIKASFVYNYFTRDERVRSNQEEKVVLIDRDYTDEIFFQVKNDTLPRYVKISFKAPKFSSMGIESINIASLIEKNIGKLTVEGATSNFTFSGIEFLDTGKEEKIYTMLKGSMFFTEIAHPKESQREAAEKLHDTLNEKGGLFGLDKKLIMESMSNVQSEGYRHGPSDVQPDVAEFAHDPIGHQTFSVQFNNLFMGDLITNAVRFPDNVFQDEMRAVESFSRELKSEILSTINPTKITEAEYDMQVKAIKIRPLPTTGNNLDKLYSQYPKIKFAGYVLEKYEITPEENVVFVGRSYSSDTRGLYMIDKNVRYGGSYFYKIRTVCQVTSIMKKVAGASGNNRIDEVVAATFLMGSEGIKIPVSCFENIPPKPPTALRVRFSGRTSLPHLTWQIPVNPQRDIKRFQIFKRFTINEPFTVVAEYNFDNSILKGVSAEKILSKNLHVFKRPRISFVDKTHVEGEKPIYAVACVDARGLSSNYSAQIQAERNRYTNRTKITLISGENAPKPYPNILVNVDNFQDAMKVSGYDRIKVFFDPEYYALTRNVEKHSIRSGNDATTTEEWVQFLRADPNTPRYSIQILNVDLQKDKIITMGLADDSSPVAVDADYYEQPVAKFSRDNLSFQYGVDD